VVTKAHSTPATASAQRLQAIPDGRSPTPPSTPPPSLTPRHMRGHSTRSRRRRRVPTANCVSAAAAWGATESFVAVAGSCSGPAAAAATPAAAAAAPAAAAAAKGRGREALPGEWRRVARTPLPRGRRTGPPTGAVTSAAPAGAAADRRRRGRSAAAPRPAPAVARREEPPPRAAARPPACRPTPTGSHSAAGLTTEALPSLPLSLGAVRPVAATPQPPWPCLCICLLPSFPLLPAAPSCMTTPVPTRRARRRSPPAPPPRAARAATAGGGGGTTGDCGRRDGWRAAIR